MIKFPYGISDFYKISNEDYFYIDRTPYLRLLEEIGPQLLFLRPRRFGKSLLLSLLENYYDLAKAAEFERLFGRFQDGDPTHLRRHHFDSPPRSARRAGFARSDPGVQVCQTERGQFGWRQRPPPQPHGIIGVAGYPDPIGRRPDATARLPECDATTVWRHPPVAHVCGGGAWLRARGVGGSLAGPNLGGDIGATMVLLGLPVDGETAT